MKRLPAGVLPFVGIVLGCLTCMGEESKSKLMQFFEQDYLLGNWGGYRTKLAERGVDFEFVYFGAVPSNVGGGIKQGSVYEGAFLMTLDLDSDKLANYHGGHLHAGGLSIHNGAAFSQNYIGDLNVVSLLDFPDSLRLWELWYEQKFLQDKVSLKVGQLALDRDFIVPEYYNTLAGITLLNQTFFYRPRTERPAPVCGWIPPTSFMSRLVSMTVFPIAADPERASISIATRER